MPVIFYDLIISSYTIFRWKINPHLYCIQEAIDSVKTLTDEETDDAANTVPSVAGTLYISPKKSDQL